MCCNALQKLFLTICANLLQGKDEFHPPENKKGDAQNDFQAPETNFWHAENEKGEAENEFQNLENRKGEAQNDFQPPQTNFWHA